VGGWGWGEEWQGVEGGEQHMSSLVSPSPLPVGHMQSTASIPIMV
jgi:hypothetical protein